MKKVITAAIGLATLLFGFHPAASAEPANLTAPEPSRPTSAQAYGDPFESVQFNICSLNCSDGSPPTGGADTNFGMTPVDELVNVAAVRGWPRIISLNEVCGQAAWVMAASLPAGMYSASFYVAARRPADCPLYGNWLAVRTGDVPASNASNFHFFWDGGTPPPEDITSEHRGGACSRSFIFLEQTWGCTVHIEGNAGRTTGLLTDVNNWFGSSAQIMLGDFNLVPTAAAINAWDTDNRDDLFDDISITWEGNNTHLDYGFAELTALDDDPSAFDSTPFLSTSDHRQLWGTAAFR